MLNHLIECLSFESSTISFIDLLHTGESGNAGPVHVLWEARRVPWIIPSVAAMAGQECFRGGSKTMTCSTSVMWHTLSSQGDVTGLPGNRMIKLVSPHFNFERFHFYVLFWKKVRHD